MNKSIKTEIILSIIGFSLLFHLLTHIIPSFVEIIYFDKEYTDFQNGYIYSTELPVYKQNSNSTQQTESIKQQSPFGNNAFQNLTNTTFTKQNNQIQKEEFNQHLSTQYSVYVQKKETANTQNIHFYGAYRIQGQSGNRGQGQSASSIQSFSSRLSSETSYNRPLFANTSYNDVILVDPMADPEEIERIPVGSNPWILLVFAAIYVSHKKWKFVFEKNKNTNKI